MTERQGFTGTQLLVAVAGGAAVGAVVALLLAPSTGRDLRARMRTLAARSKEKAARIPEAFEQAGEAAREAFVGSLQR